MSKNDIDCNKKKYKTYLINNIREHRANYEIVHNDEVHERIFNKILEDEEIKQLCKENNINDYDYSLTLDINILDEIICYFWETVERLMKFKIPYIKIPYFGMFKYKLGYKLVRQAINNATIEERQNLKEFIPKILLELYNTRYPKYKDKQKLIKKELPYLTIEQLCLYTYKGKEEDRRDKFKNAVKAEYDKLARKQDVFKNKGAFRYYKKKYKHLFENPFDKVRAQIGKNKVTTINARDYANIRIKKNS
jgi:hypothetical protein